MTKTAPDSTRPLRLILPKKGRLQEDIAPALAGAGLEILRAGPRRDFGTLLDETGDLPAVEILLQRPADALLTLQDNVADLALVGLDSIAEFNNNVPAQNRARLCHIFNDVSRCRLVIAAAPGETIETPHDLNGLRLATSYPGLLHQWLARYQLDRVQVIARSGGLEDCVRLGIADAIMDVRQTGESLHANGLEEKISVMQSSAALVHAPTPRQGTEAFARAFAQRLQNGAAEGLFLPQKRLREPV